MGYRIYAKTKYENRFGKWDAKTYATREEADAVMKRDKKKFAEDKSVKILKTEFDIRKETSERNQSFFGGGGFRMKPLRMLKL